MKISAPYNAVSLFSCCLYIGFTIISAGFSDQANKTLKDIKVDSTTIHQLDSLEAVFKGLSNRKISWDAKLRQFDSMELILINLYDSLSLQRALAIHYQGNINYSRGMAGNKGSYQLAIKNYLEAIQVRNLHLTDFPSAAANGIMKCYGNLAGIYINLNVPHEALVYLSRALHMAREYSKPEEKRRLLLKWSTLSARASLRVGDYDNAIMFYREVIYLADQDSTKLDWKWRALIETGGMQAINLNQPELAVSNLMLGIEGLTKQNKNPNINLLAGAYNNLGIAYRQIKNYTKSKNCYQKAIALNKSSDRKLELAKNYTNIGVLFKSTGQLDSAEYYTIKSIEIIKSIEYPAGLPYIYDNLADIEKEKGNLYKSLIHDNEALKHLIPGFIPASVHDNPNLDIELHDKQAVLISLASKAETLLELYQKDLDLKYLNSAYNHFVLTDKVIGQIRSQYLPDASKISLVDQTKHVYEKALDACWELYQRSPNDTLFEQAFRFSEKSRAVILLDAVRKTNARDKVEMGLISEEKAINIRANFYEKQVALQKQRPEDSFAFNIFDSLLFYRKMHSGILDSIKKLNQNYYDLVFNQQIVKCKEIQGFLNKDQALVEYFMGDSSLYTFFIGKQQKFFLKSAGSDTVKSHTSQLVSSIIQQDQSFIQPSHAVYQTLILPIAKYTAIPANLIIIPDDILSLINFEMLVTKNPDDRRIYFPDFTDYLLYNHQISYAFSATTIGESRNSQVSANQKLLAIAPTFDEGFSLQGTFFDRLDWNVYEVEQISKLYTNKRLIGNEANKETFERLAPDFGIIHFATHAKADVTEGDLSYITFGSAPSNVLYAKDLYALDINADIVVLSACQTSVGPVNRGEGIISLARGFIYAGASSVVTSLWNVRERSNNAIMMNFYQGLKRGVPKDQALREAKISFLNSITTENQELAHPYFWAPLVCIGNTDPQQGHFIKPWVQFLVIIMLIIIFFYSFRNRILFGRK